MQKNAVLCTSSSGKGMTYAEMFGAAVIVAASDDACITPYIRGTFCLHGQVASASITACGLGLVELSLNGAPISEECFVPVTSDYHFYPNRYCLEQYGEEQSHRVYCLRYDITDRLTENNCIGAALAPGFYKKYGKNKLAFRMDITYEDGSTEEILSGLWLKWTQSPLVEWNYYHGEHYNYVKYPLDGWNTADFDDSAWESVVPADIPETLFCYQDCPTDRIIRHITPKLIGETEEEYIYDLGENITGTPVLRSASESGTVIRMYCSELQDENGLPMVSAEQECSFVTDGSDRPYSLKFCWFGFQYVSVTKNAELVTCAVIHADTPRTSSFTSSNKVLNWLYESYLRTQLDNMHGGIPSDCPHYEKQGYTGDGELVCECAMMMLDAKKFYRKWLYDISDCQDIKSGHVQYTAPYIRCGGGPGGWGCAIAEVPYMYYKTYGDVSILEEFLPKVYRYFDYLEAHSEDHLVVSDQPGLWALGDWCVPHNLPREWTKSWIEPVPPAPYINNYFYIKTIGRLIEFCQVLGRHGEIPALQALAETKKDAILRHYYDPATGNFAGNQYGTNAFAIDLGLGDERTLQNMVEHYEKETWYDTGIFGTDILTRVLFEKGHADLAFRLMSSEGKYSFGRWMNDGRNTLPEYWDYERSQNHPMYGAVTKYLFQYILGIRQIGAGYRNIVIEPLCTAVLPSAAGHITTEQGVISVRYAVTPAGTVCLETEIPAGCHAVLKFRGKEYPLSAGTNKFVI